MHHTRDAARPLREGERRSDEDERRHSTNNPANQREWRSDLFRALRRRHGTSTCTPVHDVLL
jgi:hypothetical protein